jgi:hypothetical protein
MRNVIGSKPGGRYLIKQRQKSLKVVAIYHGHIGALS